MGRYRVRGSSCKLWCVGRVNASKTAWVYLNGELKYKKHWYLGEGKFMFIGRVKLSTCVWVIV